MTRMTVRETQITANGNLPEHEVPTAYDLECEELEWERYGSTGIDIPDPRYL